MKKILRKIKSLMRYGIDWTHMDEDGWNYGLILFGQNPLSLDGRRFELFCYTIHKPTDWGQMWKLSKGFRLRMLITIPKVIVCWPTKVIIVDIMKGKK